MINYVYLINSLPTLYRNSMPPITEDEFMLDISAQLSNRVLGLVKDTSIRSLNGDTKNRRLSYFIEFMNNVQNDKAAIRKAKEQKQTPKFETLPASITNENPLEREKTIMQMQWDELTALESGDPYSLKQVLIYKLKLQLLHRLHSFNAVEGQKVFNSVVHPQ